jgi:ParB family transcriptional regulator, chromosome partitioning protein
MGKRPLRFNVNPLLSGPTLEARTKSGSPYRELEIAEIDVDPEQPRREFDQEKLAELAASIKEHGLINPIMVRLLPGGSYRLIAGERRLRAFKLLGRESIPAVLDQEEEGKEVLSKQLVENLQRADLSPIERSEAVCRLRDEHGFSVRELALKLGISKSAVQRSLDIQTLPKDLLEALRRGIPESKVLLLAQVEDPRVRAQLLEKIDSLTREGLSEELKKGGASSHRGTAGKIKLPPADSRLIAQLQQALGLKVQLLRSGKKKEQGRIVVEFYSNSDLEGLVAKLLTENSPTVGQEY